VDDDVTGSAGRNGRRRHRRRVEVGAGLVVINGVLVGVGGVYATTSSITATVVAAVAAVMLAGLVKDDRGDPWPILHRRGHILRRLATWSPRRRSDATRVGVRSPAPALAASRTPAAAPHPPPARSPTRYHIHGRDRARTAPSRSDRRPAPRVEPGCPFCPPGLRPALATQRLRRGLGERRLRRRRLRRVPAVLPQLPPQLGNLSLKPGNLLSLHCDQSGKLLMGRPRINRHHIMINEL
jgi:hypothetical protein